jgi:predicted nucleic acid-binding Zn ribbon protein
VTTWRPTVPSAGERDPVPVAASLDRVTRALGVPRARLLTAVFSRWEQLVGPDIAAHARPRSLRQGTLLVLVDHPAWATQLRFLASDLLARIQLEADAPEITEIHIGVAGDQPGEGRRRSNRR